MSLILFYIKLFYTLLENGNFFWGGGEFGIMVDQNLSYLSMIVKPNDIL